MATRARERRGGQCMGESRQVDKRESETTRESLEGVRGREAAVNE